MKPSIAAVSRSPEHTFSKQNEESIRLIAGYGVEGDAHAGETVKHRYLVRKDPTLPNIHQVHLIQIELLEELNAKGFSVDPGELGENITTCGVDLLGLPTGTRIQMGTQAMIALTALRNPCSQIDQFQKGLLKEVLYMDDAGEWVRRAGVMGIILEGGIVRPKDEMVIDLPPEPHRPLAYVY